MTLYYFWPSWKGTSSEYECVTASAMYENQEKLFLKGSCDDTFTWDYSVSGPCASSNTLQEQCFRDWISFHF